MEMLKRSHLLGADKNDDIVRHYLPSSKWPGLEHLDHAHGLGESGDRAHILDGLNVVDDSMSPCAMKQWGVSSP